MDNCEKSLNGTPQEDAIKNWLYTFTYIHTLKLAHINLLFIILYTICMYLKVSIKMYNVYVQSKISVIFFVYIFSALCNHNMYVHVLCQFMRDNS